MGSIFSEIGGVFVVRVISCPFMPLLAILTNNILLQQVLVIGELGS